MELPTVRGMHLCEQVIIEEKSRNASLINAFTRRVWEGENEPHRFVLHTAMSGGRGTIQLRIQITDLATDEDIFIRTVPFVFLDPIASHRLVFRFEELIIPDAGDYEFTIFVAGESITSTRITLFERPLQ